MVVFTNTDMASLTWRLFYEFYLPTLSVIPHYQPSQFHQPPQVVPKIITATNPFETEGPKEVNTREAARPSSNPFEESAPCANRVSPVSTLAHGQQQKFATGPDPRDNFCPSKTLEMKPEPLHHAQTVLQNHYYPQYESNPPIQHYDSRYSTAVTVPNYVHSPSKEPQWGTDYPIPRESESNRSPVAHTKNQSMTPPHDRTLNTVIEMFDDSRTRGISPGLNPNKSHSRSQGGATTRTRESDEPMVVRVPVLGHPGEVVEVPVTEMDLVRATIQKAAQRRKT